MALIAVLLLAHWGAPEVSWLICIGFALRMPSAVPPRLRPALVCLILLSAVGLHGFLTHSAYDAARDWWYFTKAPAELAFGCIAARRIGFSRALQQFVIAAGIVSSEYAVRVAIRLPEFLSNSAGANRALFGAGSFLSVLGCVVLLDQRLRTHLLSAARRRRWRLGAPLALCGVVIVSGLALGLSQSRTLGLSVVLYPVIWAALNGRRTVPLVLVVGSLTAALGTAYLVIARESVPTILSRRVLAAVQEVTIADYDSPEDINTNWRGFESSLALREFGELNVVYRIIGGGFGQRVSLAQPQVLGNTEFTAIPVLHNGYLYVLVKSGILGLLLYLAALLLIGRALSSAAPKSPGAWTSAVPAWLVSSVAMSTAVIAGPFNKSELTAVLVFCGVYMAGTQKVTLGARAQGGCTRPPVVEATPGSRRP